MDELQRKLDVRENNHIDVSFSSFIGTNFVMSRMLNAREISSE